MVFSFPGSAGERGFEALPPLTNKVFSSEETLGTRVIHRRQSLRLPVPRETLGTRVNKVFAAAKCTSRPETRYLLGTAQKSSGSSIYIQNR